MAKFLDLAGLKKAMSLQKEYIDNQDKKKMDTFTPGKGLKLEGGVLNVDLDPKVFVVLQALPEKPAEENLNKIHMVPSTQKDEKSKNIYTEYVWVGTNATEGSWEKLGEYKLDVNLTGYLRRSDLTAEVSQGNVIIKKGGVVLTSINFKANSFQSVKSGNNIVVGLKELLDGTKELGLYKVAVDKNGRITNATKATVEDFKALGLVDKTLMTNTISQVVNTLKTEVNENLNKKVDPLASKVDDLEKKVGDISKLGIEIATEPEVSSLFTEVYGA